MLVSGYGGTAVGEQLVDNFASGPAGRTANADDALPFD
jgi:hypothetical protein